MVVKSNKYLQRFKGLFQFDTFSLMEEVAKHFLCMARQCWQLPEYFFIEYHPSQLSTGEGMRPVQHNTFRMYLIILAKLPLVTPSSSSGTGSWRVPRQTATYVFNTSWIHIFYCFYVDSYRLYNPLWQWHDDEILYSAKAQRATESGPRRGPSALVTPEDGSETMVAQSGALSSSHLLFEYLSVFLLSQPLGPQLFSVLFHSVTVSSHFDPTISEAAFSHLPMCEVPVYQPLSACQVILHILGRGTLTICKKNVW